MTSDLNEFHDAFLSEGRAKFLETYESNPRALGDILLWEDNPFYFKEWKEYGQKSACRQSFYDSAMLRHIFFVHSFPHKVFNPTGNLQDAYILFRAVMDLLFDSPNCYFNPFFDFGFPNPSVTAVIAVDNDTFYGNGGTKAEALSSLTAYLYGFFVLEVPR